MYFIEAMKKRAKEVKRSIVFPEGDEKRTLSAARVLKDEGLASEIFLLGNSKKIEQAAKANGIDITGITPRDPSARKEDILSYAEEYYELRKHKGMTKERAETDIQDPLKWGAMMVRRGDAYAMVAGAENSTGKVLIPAFTIIKTAPGTKYASSCFVMNTHNDKWGARGHMIFADCATIPDPTPEQLAEIAIASSDSCKTFLETEPITALLSFSTKGSASSPAVDKVLEALRIVKEKRPELVIDGELQLDAAVIPEIGEKKAPGSPVAGRANVLIFPNLSAGNIGYKLVQRFAGAHAYGPFLQGFAKPVSDLSRGCSVMDIVNTSTVTLAMEVK